MNTSAPWARAKIALLCVAVAAIALLPWIRNHKFLRDFYDYGIFINANARFDQGQRLFTDFTTPAQSAAFALNHLAERCGGGTYAGMTWGAAVLIVGVGVGLTLLLARRWPPLLAAVFASAVVACSASQHTIIFYNPIGVFAMALAVWSFAVAPLLRRESLGWHALAAAGLVVGGLNKINFHLLSCALAIGWIVWGAIGARASWRQIAGTLAFLLGFGIVLPLALELMWTGASLRTWYHNVVELPLGARGGRVGLLTDAKLYFATLHDYYGALRLPESGLVVLVLPLLAVPAALVGGAPEVRWVRRVFAVGAGLCGAVAAAALLITNNEIVYLTVAASLVMLAALWLGFNLPTRGWLPWLILALPAVMVGVCGWESAWQGQRSQFGHFGKPRTDCMRGEQIGPEFGYLRGLSIPTGMAGSLGYFAVHRRTLGKGADQVFYGPGVEWLEHIWPAPKVRGLPLVAAAFDGEREVAQLHREVIDRGPFKHVLVAEAWNSWPLSVQIAFMRRYTVERVGNFLLYHQLAPGVLWARPLAFHENIGGNVDSTRLISDMPVRLLSDGRRFVGVDRETGRLEMAAPSNRASGEAVLRRIGQRPVAPVGFEVYAVQGSSRYLRWKQEVNLPEGTDELIVPTGQVDGSGLNLEFRVIIPEANTGSVLAGWREPRLWNTVGAERSPPLLQEGAAGAELASAAMRDAVLPAVLADTNVFVREAELRDGKCWLTPGGEVWVRLAGIVPRIELTAEAGSSPAGTTPQLRVIYYKGGRLEFFHPTIDKETNQAHYTAWSSENGGWLAIIADPHRTCPPFSVKIRNAQKE